MCILTIFLDNLNFRLENTDYLKLNEHKYIYGEILGYYNPFLDLEMNTEEVIQKITASSEDEIEELLLYSLGDFFVISQNLDGTISIITSVGYAPGLYYTKTNDKLLFSQYENDIYKAAPSLSLNEDFVFNELYGEPISLLSGKTLFNDVNRIPASSNFTIYKDGSVKFYFYVIPKYKLLDEHSFDEEEYRKKLHKSIEKTVEIIADYYKDHPLYVFLSDGIDSLSVFFAMLKTGQKFTAINIANFTPLIGMVKEIEKLTKNNENINFVSLNTKSVELNNKSDFENTIEYATNNFRIGNFSSPMQAVINYFKENNITNPILLTGAGFDTIYSGRKTGSSIEVGTSFYYAYIKYFLKRFYRSYTYIKLLAYNKYSRILKLVRDKAIPYDPVNYVSSFVCGPGGLDDGFYPFTMPDKGNEFSSEEFKKIFYDVRKKETVDFILPQFNLTSFKNNPEMLNYFCRSSMTLNHYGLPDSLFDARNKGNYDIIEIGYQPSIFSLFLKLKLDSYKDLFKIKRAIFAYVNSYLGNYNTSYEKIARTCEKSNCGLEYNFLRILGNKIGYRRVIVSVYNKIPSKIRDILKNLIRKKLNIHENKKNQIDDKRKENILIFKRTFKDSYNLLIKNTDNPDLKKLLLSYQGYFNLNDETTYNPRAEKIACFVYYLDKNGIFERMKTKVGEKPGSLQ